MPVEVDKESIYENFMDDEELIFESIDMFMESSNTRCKALQEAVQQKDAERVMAEAHALKGVVGLFSPGDVFEAAKKVELMGRNNALAGIDEAFSDFKSKLDELIVILKQWRDGED
ncbi:MAG: Hpt domain-containing protein [Deltaproteobacteria bacterium]|jgi:HPt (histidine-containing phosphotransfer) domain-containing protein|nr:Hpt domain-containing protein [Deltaproteobacteria bacterium]